VADGVAAAVVGSVDVGAVDGGEDPKRLLGVAGVAAGVVVEAVAEYRLAEPRP
jgi:hypothetical protein